jgi:hypothetical protein
MNYSQNKTSFMTVAEYNEKITPTFKEFHKFLRKNEKYFKCAEYYGVVYLTYPEYFEREMAYYSKGEYKTLANKEYIDKGWVANSDRLTTEVPKDIYAKYLEFLAFFKENFGEENIRKIEKDELKSNKRSIRRAIDSDLYVNALKDEFISVEKLDAVFASLGIKIPKHILDLKNKIVSQGYNRSVENALMAQSKEFGDTLRVALNPYYEALKDVKRTNLMNIINKFEKEFESQNLYKFECTFKNRAFRQEVTSVINTFFKGDYEEGDRNKYIYKRKPNFDAILEKKASDFAEDFIGTFVFRINEKLKVVNNKLGSPTISMSDVDFNHGEFEGLVSVTWSNGVKITIEAQVIIAGGYIQVEHYRYLLKPFYKGKFIDLEDIDNLKF